MGRHEFKHYHQARTVIFTTSGSIRRNTNASIAGTIGASWYSYDERQQT